MADKQVSQAAFLKALAAKKTQLLQSAKKPRPAGLLSDVEILEKLGIEPNASKTFNGNVNTIKPFFAKDNPARPGYRFAYTIVSDDRKANGVTVSKNIILEETDYRTLEQASDDLLFELQGLGEDTDKYKSPDKEVQQAIERHTKNKTPIRITIKHWTSNDKAGMNIRVNPSDDSDLDSEEEAPDDDSQEFEEVEESQESTNDDEFVPDAWINGWIDYRFPGDDAVEADTYVLKVLSYNKKENTFDCEDEDGNPWSTEDGYGIPCDQPDLFDWSDKNDE